MDKKNMKIQSVTKLSFSKLQDKKYNGLCYSCNEKYTPNHVCQKLFIIEVVWDEQKEQYFNEGKSDEENEESEISLHAICGNVGSSTMRVYGKIKSAPVIILIDSGNTDNFISSEVVSKLQMNDTRILSVKVASSNKMRSQGIFTELQFSVQGIKFTESFHAIPLYEYDLVLGPK